MGGAVNRRVAALLVPLVPALLVACRNNGSGLDAPEAPQSPQAEAVPAPLQNATSPASSASPALLALDGGVAPVPLRGDEPVEADSPPQLPPSKESLGFSMLGVIRLGDIPFAPKGGDVNPAAVESARKKAEPFMAIDFSASRLRVVLKGEAYPLPRDTEIRARTDKAGHLALSARGDAYRTLAPGSLRAFIGEGRPDVAPVGPARVTPTNETQPHLTFRTKRVEVTTRAAKMNVDIARVADAGEGGILLCRLLLDLANAPPLTPLCGVDDVPLFAEYRWTGGGSLSFNALSLSRRTDLAPSTLLTPPAAAVFGAMALQAGVYRYLTPAELASIHSGEGRAAGLLTLTNNSDGLRFVWVDGLPVAWLSPRTGIGIDGIEQGKVQVVWRTFLGDLIDPAQSVSIPGASQIPKKESP